MGLAPVHMRPGDPADLLAIDARSIRAAIADASHNRRIYRRGVPVATPSWTSAIHR